MTGLDTTHVGLVVDELVASADRLGLRWRLRPATVPGPSPLCFPESSMRSPVAA